MPVAEATATSRVSALLEQRIHELKGKKSQRDIARIAGFKNPNMITILKQGDAKLALERVPALAEAIEVDPALLLRYALEQHFSAETVKVMRQVMSHMITKNETAILDYIREVSVRADPELNDKLRTALKGALA